MIDLMIDCHCASMNNLDIRKRAGNKRETIGFDFILDENLRVWLIEVNTCPYMGPVLVDRHENFMLDLLDDSFKITVDRLYHNKRLTLEDIHEQTDYEVIYS